MVLIFSSYWQSGANTHTSRPFWQVSVPSWSPFWKIHTPFTQPCVAFLKLVFCTCFFVFGGTHMAPNFLTLHEPVSVVSWVCIWLVVGTCLLQLAVWGWGTLSACCIRSLTTVSLNYGCGNFELQEARMMKLVKMVRYIRWKNSFFISKSVC